MATYTWPSTLYMNMDWTDSPSTNIVSNNPEVGPPIRRARSRNIKHTLAISVDMTYSEYNNTFLPFLQNIDGGVLPFNFTSPIDSRTYEAYIEGAGDGKPYTMKRNGNYLYTINLTIAYYQIGAF